MPQDAHRHTGMDVEGSQQRGAGLPSAVHGDPGNPGCGDTAVEAAVEVLRIDRGTALGGKDQAGLNPGVSGPGPVRILLLLAYSQRCHARDGQRKRSFGRFSLDLTSAQAKDKDQDEGGIESLGLVSTDPFFVEKVVDVAGLYHHPPERAVVLCVDEKSQIQALDRSQPVLPMMPGMPERRTHDYLRHGITTTRPRSGTGWPAAPGSMSTSPRPARRG